MLNSTSADSPGRQKSFRTIRFAVCGRTFHHVVGNGSSDGTSQEPDRTPQPIRNVDQSVFGDVTTGKAIGLLDKTPIGFDKSEALKAILEPKSKKENRTLLGQAEDYKPFRMSFKNLIDAYDEKQEVTREKLERLEHCIDGLPSFAGTGRRKFGSTARKIVTPF